jgi:hypothetical protein
MPNIAAQIRRDLVMSISKALSAPRFSPYLFAPFVPFCGYSRRTLALLGLKPWAVLSGHFMAKHCFIKPDSSERLDFCNSGSVVKHVAGSSAGYFCESDRCFQSEHK